MSVIDLSVAERVPQLKRGRVWCTVCGFTRRVNASECLSFGWPKCCNQTMTIDSPQERAAFALKRVEK